MTLRGALVVMPGLTSVIGGGGKSTLLRRLGKELAAEGHKTLLCTSTHMFPVQGVPLANDLAQAARSLEQKPLVCFGKPDAAGKLTQGAPMEALLSMAEYTLCEADGSKGLPLKAHDTYEPNVPRETKRLVYVVGLDGIGRSIALAAHRPALYGALLGKRGDHMLSPVDIIEAIVKEGYGAAKAVLLLNKAEGERLEWGRQAAKLWPGRAVIASLASPVAVAEVWENGRNTKG